MSVISLDGLNTLIDNLEEGILILDEERRVLAIQLLDAMIAKHNMATTLKAMEGWDEKGS